MLLAVVVLVRHQILDAEIRAQIQHPQPGLDERRRILRRYPVRQRQKRDARPRGQNRLRRAFDKLQPRVPRAGKARIHRRQRLPRELPRRQCGNLGVRMARQETDEFLARISSGSDNHDFLHAHPPNKSRNPRSAKREVSPLPPRASFKVGAIGRRCGKFLHHLPQTAGTVFWRAMGAG